MSHGAKPLTVARACEYRPLAVDDDRSLDVRRDLDQVGQCGSGIHRPDDTAAVRKPLAQPLAKFFADRGTHLAAMIAYFGLLSSVSLIFLSLAVLGWTGREGEEDQRHRRQQAEV